MTETRFLVRDGESFAPVIPLRGEPSKTRLGQAIADALKGILRIPRTRFVCHFSLWSGLGPERDAASYGMFSAPEPVEVA